MHFPAVGFAQSVMLRVAAPVGVKFAAVLGFAAALSLVSYLWISGIGWLRPVHGRKSAS